MRFDDPAILARYRQPAHAALFAASEADACASGSNPFCGDSLEMRLVMGTGEGGAPVVARATFEGHACSLCTATADLLAEYAEGRAPAELAALTPDNICALWGGLEVGRGRRGCLELPLTVLRRALA